MKGEEAQSGCRARQVGTSLVEYTLTLSILYRPNTAGAEHAKNWNESQEFVYKPMTDRIIDFIENKGRFLNIDSPIICEDITGAVREVRLHSDTQHCEHGD